MRKHTFFISVIAIAIGLAGFYYWQNELPAYPGDAQNKRMSQVDRDQYEQEIAQLKRQLVLLKEQLASKQSVHNSDVIEDEPVLADSGESLDTPYLDQQELVNQKQRGYQTASIAKQQLHKNLVEIFDVQSVDDKWANIHEEKLHSLFSESEHLSGVTISNAECKETLCRLSVFIDSPQKVEAFSTALYSQISSSPNAMADMNYLIFPQFEMGYADVYVAYADTQLFTESN